MRNLRMLGLGLPILVAACSYAEQTTSADGVSQTSVEYDLATKAIAAKLSIANSTGLENAADPLQKALLCQIGLTSLSDRIESAGMSSMDVSAGIDQARQIFEVRANEIASQVGKSRTETKKELDELLAENSDQDTNIRLALACIKKLSAEIKADSQTR